MAATCTAPKTCAVCKKTEGEVTEHIWMAATCTAPKTCAVCKHTEGEMKAHVWLEATCTAPKTCAVCNLTEGQAKDHSWTEGVCVACGATEPAAVTNADETVNDDTDEDASQGGETTDENQSAP